MSTLYCYCSRVWRDILDWFFPPSSSLSVSRQDLRQELDELVLSSHQHVETTTAALCQLLEQERQKRYKLEKAYLDMNAEIFNLQFELQRLHKRLDQQQRHKQREHKNRERARKRELKHQRQRTGIIKEEEEVEEEKDAHQ